jgi:hypothetical protein
MFETAFLPLFTPPLIADVYACRLKEDDIGMRPVPTRGLNSIAFYRDAEAYVCF